jgi:hypothetical protein
MTRPDFSGRWQFNPGKSLLEIPSPDSTIFVIEHDEPRFHLTRTHVHGGKSDTFSIELTTDGEIVEFNHAGLVVRASLQWEGMALMFDSTLDRNGEQATNIVRYELSDDNQILLAHEWFRSKSLNYDNRWVFDRQ